MRNANIYGYVSQQIIAAIETGVAARTYCMPRHNWGKQLIRPINATTGLTYRGINTLLLWVAAEAGASWATYRQLALRG